MERKTIDKINIYYPEDKVEIENIETIINKNRFLFNTSANLNIIIDPNRSDRIKAEDNHTIIIQHFDDLFEFVLKQVLKDSKHQSILNQPNVMTVLYIQLLNRKVVTNEQNYHFFVIPQDLTEDDFYSMLAMKYFDPESQFTQLANFLKTRKNQEQMFEWLQQKERFNAYNYILGIIVKDLKAHDLSFFTTMDKILYKMQMNNLKSFFVESKEDSKINLPKLSLKQNEIFFLGFLKQIHAPKEWVELYFSLKEKNYILYEEPLEVGKDNSECFFDQHDQVYKLRITQHNNVQTFLNLIHEFIHYVSILKGESKFSIIEFPSIYYEKRAGSYLISKGYDPKVVANLLSRQKDNNKIFLSLTELFLDINRYAKGKPIRREEKIDLLEKSREEVLEERELLIKVCEKCGISLKASSFLEIQKLDYGKKVDRDCDFYTSAFLKEGFNILHGYQYLIDDYLAEIVFENMDEDIEQAMIEITTNLPNYDIYLILERLNLTEIFTKKETEKELKEAINAYQKVKKG